MAPWQFRKKQIKCMEGSPKCMECLKKCGGAGTRKIKKSMRGNYDIFNCGCGFKCVESKDMKNCNDMQGGRKKMLTPVYMPAKGFVKATQCVNGVCQTRTAQFDIPDSEAMDQLLGALGTAGDAPLMARLKHDFTRKRRTGRHTKKHKRKGTKRVKRKSTKHRRTGKKGGRRATHR